MRVCEAHKIKAVITLKSSQDDSEHDLCPECYEAFNLIVSGAFFEKDLSTTEVCEVLEGERAKQNKRGRPRKEATT